VELTVESLGKLHSKIAWQYCQVELWGRITGHNRVAEFGSKITGWNLWAESFGKLQSVIAWQHF